MRIKEQETRLTLQEHDDDDDDDDDDLFQTKSAVGTLSLRVHSRYVRSSKGNLPKAIEEVCSYLRQMSNIGNCVYPRDKGTKCNLGTNIHEGRRYSPRDFH